MAIQKIYLQILYSLLACPITCWQAFLATDQCIEKAKKGNLGQKTMIVKELEKGLELSVYNLNRHNLLVIGYLRKANPELGYLFINILRETVLGYVYLSEYDQLIKCHPKSFRWTYHHRGYKAAILFYQLDSMKQTMLHLAIKDRRIKLIAALVNHLRISCFLVGQNKKGKKDELLTALSSIKNGKDETVENYSQSYYHRPFREVIKNPQQVDSYKQQPVYSYMM
ncbi:MAG: hypothetical protein AAF770_00905 [Bacteroidota bacterium]